MRRVRHLILSLILLGSLVTVTAGFVAVHRNAEIRTSSVVIETVKLPILVMGSHTGSSTTTVTVTITDPSDVDRFWFEMHSPGYSRAQWYRGAYNGYPRKKASLRVNDGDWIDLSDETATCAEPEKDPGYGCIEGPWWKPRFTIEVDPSWDLRSGSNSIDFRFNYVAPDLSSGYRVLGIAALRASYAGSLGREEVLAVSAIDGTTFTWDDPGAWGLPNVSGTPASNQDVADGEALWKQRDVLQAWPALDGTSQRMFKAACADCHASDGHDLKYFNYETETIIKRAQHHGLTQEEGEKIAAFIRSIQLHDSNGTPVEAPGRPWWAPYQPGPKLAATNVHPDGSDPFYWSSGSGMHLEREEDMLPFIFPDGHGGVDRLADGSLNWRHVQTDSTLNLREIPIVPLFPDWNEWLPRVSPVDAIPSFLQSAAWQGYLDAQQHFANGSLKDVERSVDAWWTSVKDVLPKKDESGVVDPWSPNDASPGLMQWHAVKVWEQNTLNYSETLAGDHYPQAEARQWAARYARSAFDVAPHIHRGRPYSPDHASFDSYLDGIWYYSQLVVNSGTKRGVQMRPVDWKYHLAHLTGLGSDERRAGLAFLISFVKLIQNGDVDGTVDHFTNWRHTTPAWLFYRWKVFNGLTPNITKDVQEAVLRSYNHFLYKNPTSDWPRAAGDKSSLTPESATDFRFGIVDDKEYHAHFFGYAKRLSEIGVDAAALDSLSRWGEAMWPNGDWEAFFYDGNGSGGDPPPGGDDSGANVVKFTLVDADTDQDIQTLRDGDVVDLSISTSRSLNIRADTDPAVVTGVRFSLNDVGNYRHETTVPYSLEGDENGDYNAWTPSAGDYVLEATAYIDKEGETTVGTPYEIAFSVKDDEAAGPVVQEIRLLPGWNLASSWVAPASDAIEDVFAEISASIVVVKDVNGESYIPEYGLNEIGAWDPSQAYMIYATEEIILRIEGIRMSADAPIGLKAGWNYVAFPREGSMPADEAFSSIEEELVLVKDVSGRLYNPTYAINSIGVLEPGQGYIVYVTEDALLTF